MATDTTSIDEVMSAYEALWNGDFSKTDVLAESVVVQSPTIGEAHGRDAVEQVIREMHAAFPDFHIETDEMLAGDETVMLEWTITGTHEGEYMGAPPTGREIEVQGMAKLQISDGKVHEDRIYSNPQEMLAQLGLADE